MNGGFCLGTPAYGYKKAPESTNRLVPDENAPIVMKMFQIANYLRDSKILTPTAYSMTAAGKSGSSSYSKYPYDWAKNSVYGILSNPIYTGKLVCMRYMTKSFKDKRIVIRPENEWITTEGTHEALVSDLDFETVQRHISTKQDSITSNPDNIFRGLVFCADCDKRLGFSKRKDHQASKGCYRCQTSIRHGTSACSAHYITYEQLETVVLNDIQRHASLSAENSDTYIDYLTKISEQEMNGEKVIAQKEAEKSKKRISELDTLLQKMYEDKVFGIISEERYISMSHNMENEMNSLKIRLSELNSFLTEHDKKSKDANAFEKLIRGYTCITKLTEELVHMLIEKIVVHEREKANDQSFMRIDIYYRFIGSVGSDDGRSITVTKRNV